MLSKLIATVDAINLRVGRLVMWLTVLMALIQFAIVILRYVFSIGFIPMQESVWYLLGIIFMLGAGFTLRHDGHVRVDVYYREAAPRRKALIDLAGAILFVIPLCVATGYLAVPYILQSWMVFEGSTEVSGLPFIFLLKTVIWLFALLVGLQGAALAVRAILALRSNDVSYRASAWPDARAD